MLDIELLRTRLKDRFAGILQEAIIDRDELTIEVNASDLYNLCMTLRDESAFAFRLLVDVTVVDYLHYGLSEWETDTATSKGFSRGVEPMETTREEGQTTPRFAVVYHVLS